MLGPVGLRWMLPLGFVLMTVTPWVLLSAEGRRQIGLSGARHRSSYFQALAWGSVAALACFSIAWMLFGSGRDNAFMSIAGNYRSRLDTTGFSVLKLHLFFTVPAMVFSPIGEEIFFRGLLQRALEERLSAKASTLVESLAFGLVHLCHHGLMAGAAGWTLLPFSGGLWVVLMFSVAMLFAMLRRRSGSLFPALASHVAFNATMNILIFSYLWQFVT